MLSGTLDGEGSRYEDLVCSLVCLGSLGNSHTLPLRLVDCILDLSPRKGFSAFTRHRTSFATLPGGTWCLREVLAFQVAVHFVKGALIMRVGSILIRILAEGRRDGHRRERLAINRIYASRKLGKDLFLGLRMGYGVGIGIWIHRVSRLLLHDISLGSFCGGSTKST